MLRREEELPVAEATDEGRAPLALDDVLREHGPMLARIAATYEADPMRREELVQEIVLAIWRSLQRFEGRSSVRTFIARIAHNRGVSHVGREVRRPQTFDHDEGVAHAVAGPSLDPAQQVHAEQTYDRLVAAVARLPLGPRQVISLALEGFDNGEIADALGISVNNVGVRLNRARRVLREELGA
ncbi:MAG: RNA polymerase sigma factor [Pseudomonadota bacterium]